MSREFNVPVLGEAPIETVRELVDLDADAEAKHRDDQH